MLKKTLIAALFAVAFAGSAQAQMKYVSGTDYSTLATPIADIKAGQIVEFFWYGCGHCYALEPSLQKWLGNGKDASVEFVRVPAYTGNWEGGARLYYVVRELGMNASEMDQKIFDAVHKEGKRGIIFDKGAAMKFLVENGAKQEDVEKVWKSLAVQQKLNQARSLFEASQLDGVPGFIVDGKYVIGADGDYPRLFDKLNTLVTKNTANKTEEAKPADAAKAEEAKPADAAKAEEAKSADATKTEEAKPADAAKAEEAKPADAAKTEEAKPAEEKPAETKPTA